MQALWIGISWKYTINWEMNTFLLAHFLNHPGLVSEVLMRKKGMEVLANLKNIVILDCDKDALYKKVQSASGPKGLNAHLSLSWPMSLCPIQIWFYRVYIYTSLYFINVDHYAWDAL